MTAESTPSPATASAGHDGVDRRLSVAPMMDWTDRHDRWFLRQLTRRTLLYTEMVPAPALLHGDADMLLGHDPAEHPLALQVGGSDPDELARVARIAAGRGFAEINLNVGCPSDRVSKGRFGACLMAEPALVADCLAALSEGFGRRATVKHRIGIDALDSYDHLTRFVETLARGGTRTFIVHARKAWLSGLSPKENREIPPLRHEVVHRLKGDFPALEIILNGGIRRLDDALPHLGGGGLDGVMIGRAAYETPYILAEADRRVFGDTAAPVPERAAVVQALVPYVRALVAQGQPITRVTRHVLGLFHGCPGARAWRRHLSEEAPRRPTDPQVLQEALALVSWLPSQPVSSQPAPAPPTPAWSPVSAS